VNLAAAATDAVWAAAIALGVWRRDRLAAAAGGATAALAVVAPQAVVAGVLAGQAARCTQAWAAGRALRRREPERRVIGAGFSARSVKHWKTMAREHPVRAALASRFVPGEQEALFTSAGFTRSASAGLIVAAAVSWSLWTVLFVGVPMLGVVLIATRAWATAGPAGLAAGLVLSICLPRPAALSMTRNGRRQLRIAWHRMIRREYWPAGVQYALLSPLLVRLGLRHGAAAFTCCNPGITGGGGMVGESKKAILEGLNGSTALLAAELIAPAEDPEGRVRSALDAIARRSELGGFPVMLKPDAGERGFAVHLARCEEDVRRYFRRIHSAALVQRFHPGPHECGVLWVRVGGADGRRGRVFSITRKEFPVVTGDGRRTLEDLIHDHPRLHCQAAVFLERFAEQREQVLALGQTMRLAQAGNHCQGTLFRDGTDLKTPALEEAIDAAARSFVGGLDIGRFDLRYESDELLRQGQGFAIVELNGTAGESTNIYDPDRSIWWAYSVLAEQWRLMYRLGAERQQAGARPMPLWRLWRDARRHFRQRSGSAISD
jgi:membrane protein DedA with SNARE-associated domain